MQKLRQMNKFFCFILAVGLSFSAAAQEHYIDSVFTKVDKPPVYLEGGEQGMFEVIRRNIKYPKDAIMKGIEGRVFVEFTVDKEGRLKDAEVVKGIGGGCDEEALRAVNLLQNWEPAMHNNQKVAYRYVMPVSFKLAGRKSKKRKKDK
ncbi:MAG: energy transducer TonB [Chitinophagaceae bacterium]|nr:MAG: energy transducer TonB [Chitinophagaceae bacterium]